MVKNEGLVALARDFMGYSWSMGVGGFGSLGDRVSRARVVAQIGDDTDIIDAAAFQTRLGEAVANGNLNEEQLSVVQQLPGAWDRRNSGHDDDD